MKPKSQTQGRIRMKNWKSLIDSPLYVRILCSGCFEIIRLHFFFFQCMHTYIRAYTNTKHTHETHTQCTYVYLFINPSLTLTQKRLMYVYERFRHILKLFKLTNDYISVEIKREKRRKENNTERKLEES